MSDFENRLKALLSSYAEHVDPPAEPSVQYFRHIQRRQRRLVVGFTAVVSVAGIALTSVAISNISENKPVEVATADGIAPASLPPTVVPPAPLAAPESVTSSSHGRTAPSEAASPATHSVDEQGTSGSVPDDVASSGPARSINALVAQHPDVFVGVYADGDTLVAVLEQGTDDVHHWEEEIRKAGQPSPTRVEVCSASIEQLNDVRRELEVWAANWAPEHSKNISVALDTKTCTVRVHAHLTEAEKQELISRFKDLVSFEERFIKNG